MQEIDKLLDHVTISAASVCGNLKTMKTSFDELKKEIEELKTCKENLLKELNREATCKALDLKGHQTRETALVDELAKKNEEIKELKKEMEWQKKKLQEFDHVLTKYRAKIKELEGHDEKSQLAILAGAYAIRKHFDGGAYYSIATNGLISWKRAEQVLMDMITKE